MNHRLQYCQRNTDALLPVHVYRHHEPAHRPVDGYLPAGATGCAASTRGQPSMDSGADGTERHIP